MKKYVFERLSEYFLKRNSSLKTLTAVCLCLIFLASCSGPLKINYKTSTPAVPVKEKDAVSVFLEPFKDSRTDIQGDPRTIGDISATVADIYTNKLTLSEDVASIVTKAFADEFSSAGYAVKTGENAEKPVADFVLTGEVKKFRLDIKERDRIEILVSLRLIEKETGRVVWSGDQEEKNERFAGVMGNSRATISNYISSSLSKIITRTLSEAGPKIANTKAVYIPAQQAIKKASPEGTGRLVITTEPIRSKVYINDVYYGLTPFSADIEPGIYDLTVKQTGFKSAKEKVSVRTGQLTEMELKLEKE